MKGRKEFPNDWSFYKKIKPKHFRRVSFKDFVEHRLNAWDLIPEAFVVARAHCLDTGSIQERTVFSHKEMNQFLKKLAKSGGEYDVFCVDHVHSFTLQMRSND